jgi:hypothetical protein
VVGAQQATEALRPHHGTRLATHSFLLRDQVVVEPLMIALGMIMREVLLDHGIERTFTQHDHLCEGFFLDGAHEPFTGGGQVRTVRGQADRLPPTRLKQCVEGLGECCVPVMDQIPFPEEKTIARVRQLARALLHKGSRGMGRDAGHLHAPCGEFHDDEHVICDETVPGRHLHGEAVRRR